MAKRRNNPIAKKAPERRTESKHVQIAEQYQGPIPPPSYLSQYETIHAGLADRIVTMAEKEQEHRQDLERRDLDAAIQANSKEFAEARFGQVFALIIGSSGVVGLVSVFVLGRNFKSGNSHQNNK